MNVLMYKRPSTWMWVLLASYMWMSFVIITPSSTADEPAIDVRRYLSLPHWYVNLC